MLQQFMWFLHITCALFIIILVLLQHGKGAEMGAAMGGGASQTIFGSSGSGSFLTKMTTIFALIFAITSISLSFFINHKSNNTTISEMIKQEEVQGNDFLPLDQQEPVEETNNLSNNNIEDLNIDE